MGGEAVSSGFAIKCTPRIVPTLWLSYRKATQEIATQSYAGSTMGPQAYPLTQDPPWGHRCTPSCRIHHEATGVPPPRLLGQPQSGPLLQTRYQAIFISFFPFFPFIFFCVFCILNYFPLFAFKTRSCYYMAQASFRVLYLLRAGITFGHHHESFVCPVSGYAGRVFWLQKTK